MVKTSLVFCAFSHFCAGLIVTGLTQNKANRYAYQSSCRASSDPNIEAAEDAIRLEYETLRAAYYARNSDDKVKKAALPSSPYSTITEEDLNTVEIIILFPPL